MCNCDFYSFLENSLGGLFLLLLQTFLGQATVWRCVSILNSDHEDTGVSDVIGPCTSRTQGSGNSN